MLASAEAMDLCGQVGEHRNGFSIYLTTCLRMRFYAIQITSRRPADHLNGEYADRVSGELPIARGSKSTMNI